MAATINHANFYNIPDLLLRSQLLPNPLLYCNQPNVNDACYFPNMPTNLINNNAPMYSCMDNILLNGNAPMGATPINNPLLQQLNGTTTFNNAPINNDFNSNPAADANANDALIQQYINALLQQHYDEQQVIQLKLLVQNALCRAVTRPGSGNIQALIKLVDILNGTQKPERKKPKKKRNYDERYKTELCRPFLEAGDCKYGDKCQFAHGVDELRDVVRHPKYKTEFCRTFHSVGFCPYGPRCHFVHNTVDPETPEGQPDNKSTTDIQPETVAAQGETDQQPQPQSVPMTPPIDSIVEYPFLDQAIPARSVSPPALINSPPRNPPGDNIINTSKQPANQRSTNQPGKKRGRGRHPRKPHTEPNSDPQPCNGQQQQPSYQHKSTKRKNADKKTSSSS